MSTSFYHGLGLNLKGEKGEKGDTGPQGLIGPVGPQGTPGPQGIAGTSGSDGAGIPLGGAARDVLRKASGANNDVAWVSLKESFIIACTGITTPATAGAVKEKLRIPYSFNITDIRASLNVPQASGLVLTIDVKRNGVSILSTKLTIDNGETTSVTASSPCVISSGTLTSDDEVTIDIVQIGDGAARGVKVTLIGIQ